MTLNIEIEAFPRCINLIRTGRSEFSYHHFTRGSAHTFLTHDDEFGGRNIRLLTNDVDLLESLAISKFGPPPPWVIWYDLGPVPYNQGDPDFWSAYIWAPYWKSLSAEERDIFLERWRDRTRSYIAEAEWEEWVFKVQMEASGGDPESR
ncbi:hypothetical protein EV147_1931 [Cupriavidus agavae]|uniref:Uncharacterized protein n=1 Tax=Cupriavidus agavae TaxID=1001822 RepID=A0A4Q7S8Z2_9BURK|nr:hypothetical protein EV147_1931 [Cupriavidus agavae]